MSHYYDHGDLGRFSEIGENKPELAQKFFDWYGEVFKDGALTAREKFAALGLAPVFVTADASLLGFAAAEGLGADDPNRHP